MERRIKLTDEDLEIIAEALDMRRDSAIDTKRELSPEELPEHEEYIDRLAFLQGEFESRIPDEDE